MNAIDRRRQSTPPPPNRRAPRLAIWLIAIVLLPATPATAATLTATVDRNAIGQNETLTLRLEYTAEANADQLDLSALQQDFEVLALQPQTATSVSIVNGTQNQQTTTSWTLTLAPRRQGTLIIPAFNLRGAVSSAIPIAVTAAPASNPLEQPLSATLTAPTDTAHLGEQILLRLELLAQANVGNLSGQLLDLDNAEVVLLDQRSTRRIDQGIERQVLHLSYALFAEKPGPLRIPPQLFTATMGAQTSLFRRGQRISARSRSKTLRIQPPPDSSNNGGRPWFPAQNVTVRASWAGDTTAMRVGEPLTRTIEITARGQRAAAIPPLFAPPSPAYKSYRDQPQLDDQKSQTGLTGTRRQATAIVPTAAGPLQLPEQRLSWWDTTTRQWREAILPAESFTVLPARQDSGLTLAEGTTSPLPGANPNIGRQHNPWPWQLATALLALLCIAQFCERYRAHRPQAKKPPQSPPEPSAKKHWQRLQKTLQAGDAPAVRTALLAWAQAHWQHPHPSLHNIAARSPTPELGTLLADLDAHLYRAAEPPDMPALARELSRLRKQPRRPTPADTSVPAGPAGLAALYPE